MPTNSEMSEAFENARKLLEQNLPPALHHRLEEAIPELGYEIPIIYVANGGSVADIVLELK